MAEDGNVCVGSLDSSGRNYSLLSTLLRSGHTVTGNVLEIDRLVLGSSHFFYAINFHCSQPCDIRFKIKKGDPHIRERLQEDFGRKIYDHKDVYDTRHY